MKRERKPVWIQLDNQRIAMKVEPADGQPEARLTFFTRAGEPVPSEIAFDRDAEDRLIEALTSGRRKGTA